MWADAKYGKPGQWLRDDSIRGGLRGASQPPPQANHGERNYAMTTPAKADVDDATKEALTGIALGDLDVLERALELREAWQAQSGLDARAFSLVKIAALIAVDAPPASYLWQVSNALDAGATPNEILGVMRAIAPQVGGPRVVAAAPEIMVALGLSLPSDGDFD
jgi:alkylhydroperoxidase/carboxymuconolactone decarboxylase family protein YurZ